MKKKKKNDVFNYRKISRERIFSITVKLIRKFFKPHQITVITVLILFENINMHHVKSVILFGHMVSLASLASWGPL